jgi:voltage-gated potassium channel Kch
MMWHSLSGGLDLTKVNTMKQGLRRWSVVVLLIGIAFELGFVGFSKTDEPHNFADAIYLTLQLFVLESGFIDGKINTELQIARFLAPVAAAYAIVQTVVVVFSLQAQRVWLRLFGGHIIVCGLGRKGVRLVEQLRGQGKRVVVIEPDEQNHELSHCRRLGAMVLVGRADDPWTLRKAIVHRASTLISVAGDDGVNIETAVRAHDLNHMRTDGSLRCVIHVRDPDLQGILKHHAIFSLRDDPFELSLFNAFETASRVMLREPSVLAFPRDLSSDSPHVLVVGFGRMGEALTSRLIRDWRIDYPDATGQLRITIADLDASEKEEAFHLRHPQLAKNASIEFISTDVRGSSFASGEFLVSHNDSSPIAAAYVCLDEDSIAALAALTMRRWLSDGIAIIVSMSQEAGLATLLETTGNGGVITGVRAVGLLEIACTLESVLGGTREILAQAIHQGYIQDQTVLGITASENPSMRPWHDLSADLKESNRAQANDVSNKLKAIGCEMQLKASGQIQVMRFTDAQVEQLAEMEHQRFVQERKEAGWTLGKTKDVSKRVSPYLIPWGDKDLLENIKDYDRNTVRRLPAILAKADYEICRTL